MHWAQDGKLSPEHFQSRVHDVIMYEGTTEELLERTIALFSYEGQWVIDLLGNFGKALKHIFNTFMLDLGVHKCIPNHCKRKAIWSDKFIPELWECKNVFLLHS